MDDFFSAMYVYLGVIAFLIAMRFILSMVPFEPCKECGSRFTRTEHRSWAIFGKELVDQDCYRCKEHSEWVNIIPFDPPIKR